MNNCGTYAFAIVLYKLLHSNFGLSKFRTEVLMEISRQKLKCILESLFYHRGLR